MIFEAKPTFYSMGIDVGTTGVRTAVVDSEHRFISNASVEFDLLGRINKQDATHWWIAVRKCIHQQIFNLSKFSIDIKQIKFLTVNGTSGTIVMVDKNLNPVTRPLTYDSKGFDLEAESITRQAPQSNHISVGNNTVLARALRLQSEDINKKAKYLLHQADFIMALLSGKGGNTDKNNALKLGYDFENECWPKWYSNTGLRPELLPKVFPVGHKIGNITPQLVQEFGFSKRTIICCGTTDSIAGFLACSSPTEGVAVTSLGTTLAIKLASTTRIDDPSIGLYSHRLNGLWLVGGASNTGGGVLKKYFNHNELKNLSNQIDTNSVSGLNYYPLRKKGERFPFNDGNFLPRMSPRPKNDILFLHGLLEGVASIEALCYQEIRKRGGPQITKLFTCGGGAKNDAWSRIRSKKLGMKVISQTNTEASIGTAFIPLLKLKP